MAKPFIWFGPETTEKLLEQLLGAGRARLEIHEDDNRNFTLQVVPELADRAPAKPLGPLNESHWCPPDC